MNNEETHASEDNDKLNKKVKNKILMTNPNHRTLPLQNKTFADKAALTIKGDIEKVHIFYFSKAGESILYTSQFNLHTPF